jgi:hypothetical protein
MRPVPQRGTTWHKGGFHVFKKGFLQSIFLKSMKQISCTWIQLADTMTGTYVGYCIRSISVEKTGEVESLFADAVFRQAGISTALVTRGFAWMDSAVTVRKQVSAMAFCRKSGFYPRLVVLEQKTDPD